jgi:hypothetical protein
MDIRFNEHNFNAEDWDMIGYGLRCAASVAAGTTILAPRTVGRHLEALIDAAEYLEAAAKFLRRTEAALIEKHI